MARRGNERRGGGRTGGRNGGRGRTPARQEYSEEGSVHTKPEVSMHGTGPTHVEEQQFTFEPEVRAALACEFTELIKGDEAVDAMMWTDLKTLVIKNFCPRNEIEKVEREFLGIKVRTYVKASAPTTYDSAVELRNVVFDDLALNVVSIEEPIKKLSFPAKQSTGKLFGAWDKQARVGETAVCGKCEVRHAGEYRLGTNLCYKCGNTRHYSRECMQGIKALIVVKAAT
ncbi:hypothetical protein L1987_60084 [Smallanthus sonchifolius]|uniref:Uncharacterized protein n=1 Tax=Smallanthus sonchifolius TaxID=185202 RepID=A0ACB9D712_9ASTR|nr:hypothetical protein L1987_60084 [Smallanthus sonchifolius]